MWEDWTQLEVYLAETGGGCGGGLFHCAVTVIGLQLTLLRGVSFTQPRYITRNVTDTCNCIAVTSLWPASRGPAVLFTDDDEVVLVTLRIHLTSQPVLLLQKTPVTFCSYHKQQNIK